MKFGKQLARHRFPEWEAHYLDYKGLKKFLDKCGGVEWSAREGELNRWDEWDSRLWHEIQKVDDHFTKILSEVEVKLDSIQTTLRELDRKDAAENSTHRKHLENEVMQLMKIVQNLVDFSSMNYTALYKILKKHDKMNTEGIKKMSLLEQMDQRPFHGPEGRRRIEFVQASIEELNEKMGGEVTMRYWEHTTRVGENYTKIAFWIGFICMGLIDTVAMYIIPATNDDFSKQSYLTLFPIFRFFFDFILLLWVAAWVIHVFETYKVNYVFLLNIDPKCQVRPKAFLNLAAAMSGAWLLTFWAFLADYKFRLFTRTEYVHGPDPDRTALYPFILLITQVFILAKPRPSSSLPLKYKWMLVQVLGHCFTAPFLFRPVTFASNIMGDVLTSFSKPLLDLVYTVCYFSSIFSDHVLHSGGLECTEIRTLWPCTLLLMLPYTLRLLQSFRRYYDDGRRQHIANAVKYSASLAVAVISGMGISGPIWFGAYLFASLYSYFWDIVFDWGLLRKDGSQLRFLRKTSMYPHKFYMLFAVLDFIGRSTWLMGCLVPQGSHFGSQLFGDGALMLFSTMEIVRRGLWTIVRVEHEHLTNHSRYRTLCWVPPLAIGDKSEKEEGAKSKAKEEKRKTSKRSSESDEEEMRKASKRSAQSDDEKKRKASKRSASLLTVAPDRKAFSTPNVLGSSSLASYREPLLDPKAVNKVPADYNGMLERPNVWGVPKVQQSPVSSFLVRKAQSVPASPERKASQLLALDASIDLPPAWSADQPPCLMNWFSGESG